MHIHVTLSQLWRRSGTLAWVVPATTSPKSNPKVGFTHKNRPAQPFPPRRHDKILIIVTPCDCRPPQQDPPPLRKTPPDTPCMFDRVGGVYCASAFARAPTQKIEDFLHRRARANTQP